MPLIKGPTQHANTSDGPYKENSKVQGRVFIQEGGDYPDWTPDEWSSHMGPYNENAKVELEAFIIGIIVWRVAQIAKIE